MLLSPQLLHIKRLPEKEYALLSLYNNTLNVIIMKINGIRKNKSELNLFVSFISLKGKNFKVKKNKFA